MSPSLIEPGKPHVFLLATPQQEKDHVANCAKSIDAIAEYGDIIDALFEIVEDKALSDDNLALLCERMTSRFKIVYEQAGRRLVQLSHYFETARTALFELLSHNRCSVRVRVVQALWSDTPPADVTDKIIRTALQDKSSNVRSFAASRVTQLKLNHLKGELREARAIEDNEKVISEIDFALQELSK
ncbi:MAG: hypothetical protein ACYS7Y_06015 [Planctomycetota bacterium]|jgi:hypothetical protein